MNFKEYLQFLCLISKLLPKFQIGGFDVYGYIHGAAKLCVKGNFEGLGNFVSIGDVQPGVDKDVQVDKYFPAYAAAPELVPLADPLF